MQTASTGTKFDIGSLGLFGVRLGTIPYTGAAVYAFLSIEDRHTVLSGGNGLAGTDLHANLRFAIPAQVRIEEDDMVRIARRRLDLASQQKRILMGDQKFSIKWNGWPARTIH